MRADGQRLLEVFDRDQVVAAVDELESRGEAVAELRRLLDRGASTWSSPPVEPEQPDLPPMPPEKRPQDPGMHGSDIRFEGYHVEIREHAGEYPDTMPQVIK